MRTKCFGWVALILTAFSNWVHTDQHETATPTVCNYLFVGPTYHHVDADSSSGDAWGFKGIWDYVGLSGEYFALDFTWVTGDLEGDTARDLTEYEIQGRAGYVFAFPKHSFFLAPFVGIGYLNNEQDLKAVPMTTITNEKWYLPVGFKAGLQLSERWGVGLEAQMRFDLVSQFQTSLEDSRWTDRELEYGYLLEMPVVFGFGSIFKAGGLVFRLAPFYKWDKYGEEKVGIGVAGGAHHYTEWGANLQLGYIF